MHEFQTEALAPLDRSLALSRRTLALRAELLQGPRRT